MATRGSLKTLTLDANELHALPEWLSHLTRLQHLSLASNKLRHVPEVVRNLPSLTRLGAADNELIDLPAWLHGARCESRD